MYPQDNYTRSYAPSHSEGRLTLARVMKNVYLWMALALVITGLTAMAIATQPAVVATIMFNSTQTGVGAGFWILFIAELGIVWALSSRIMQLSLSTAGILFAVYAILNGVFFSSIFLVYTMESIAQTFLVTAGVFGTMGIVGLFIKKDLSAIGRVLYMLLIGLIIATVVNLFFDNSAIMTICNYAGVVIFTGLTAYDTQKIKNMLLQIGTENEEVAMKVSLLGSLSLYLDFINLFLYLLRFLGNRRN